MGRAISIGGIEKKAADGSSHAAFTPCVIDFQSVYGFRVSILSYQVLVDAVTSLFTNQQPDLTWIAQS
jgi:hypothetical protein